MYEVCLGQQQQVDVLHVYIVDDFFLSLLTLHSCFCTFSCFLTKRTIQAFQLAAVKPSVPLGTAVQNTTFLCIKSLSTKRVIQKALQNEASGSAGPNVTPTV